MKEIVDKFSKQSVTYKKFRPTYPDDLFEFIYSLCSKNDTAWDCGTGNGQVAAILADSFKKVFASDISEKQIRNAESKENIFYAVERAETTSLQGKSIDLITVAQAFHWLDFEAFNKEAKRVLKPNGTIAVWGYGLLRIDPQIDVMIDRFYEKKIGSYWDKERRHIDDNYRSIIFDFDEVDITDKFQIQTNWTHQQLEGYFNSWSSVQNYIEQNNGVNPVGSLMKDISDIWKMGVKQVSFPIFLRVGKLR